MSLRVSTAIALRETLMSLRVSTAIALVAVAVGSVSWSGPAARPPAPSPASLPYLNPDLPWKSA